MIVYIDTNYACHTDNAAGRSAVDVPFFDGHGKRFVENFRYIPKYETYIRPDGKAFIGESLIPLGNYMVLAAQDEADAAYQSLGAVVQMLYDSDMEVIG